MDAMFCYKISILLNYLDDFLILLLFVGTGLTQQFGALVTGA